MQEFSWQSFITLFVIIDPFASIPIFLSLCQGKSKDYKNKVALRTCLICVGLITSFAFIGDTLLDAMHISEPAFRITGGVILFFAALDMVLGKAASVDSSNNQEETDKGATQAAVFPLAMPMLAGPGALTASTALMRQAQTIQFEAQFIVLIALVTVFIITYIGFRMGELVMKVIGETGINIILRIFGVILMALSIQGVLSGISSFYKIIL